MVARTLILGFLSAFPGSFDPGVGSKAEQMGFEPLLM